MSFGYSISALDRYKRAYVSARIGKRTVKRLKRIGWFGAVLVVIISIATTIVMDNLEVGLALTLPSGFLLSLMFFWFFRFQALLLSFQTTLVQACMDGVVNVSPFLTDDERSELQNFSRRRVEFPIEFDDPRDSEPHRFSITKLLAKLNNRYGRDR